MTESIIGGSTDLWERLLFGEKTCHRSSLGKRKGKSRMWGWKWAEQEVERKRYNGKVLKLKELDSAPDI